MKTRGRRQGDEDKGTKTRGRSLCLKEFGSFSAYEIMVENYESVSTQELSNNTFVLLNSLLAPSYIYSEEELNLLNQD